jgi:hypothetical protein
MLVAAFGGCGTGVIQTGADTGNLRSDAQISLEPSDAAAAADAATAFDAATPSDGAIAADAAAAFDAATPSDGAIAADAATAFDAATPSDAAHDAATPADAAEPPDAGFPVYSDSRDGIGAYVWGINYSTYPGTPDKLNWGVNVLTALGGRTVRVYLGPDDTYGFNGGAPFDLVSAASSAPYVALFSNPAIHTVLLTTYTLTDSTNDWVDGYSNAQQSAEAGAIEALATHLLTAWPSKIFVILNWEGDNAVQSALASHPAAWDGFTTWIQARHQGVVSARAANPGSGGKIFSGLEFSLVRNASTGVPCDNSANKCVISTVAPQVAVDLYSYSSWQSMGADTDETHLAARLGADLDFAYSIIHGANPSIGRQNLILGEFGSAREVPAFGECAAARRAKIVVDAARSWGVGEAVYWQVIDNVLDSTSTWIGFGLQKADGTNSMVLGTVKSLYQTQVATVPTVSLCTAINPGGVVDGVTFTSTIHPGATISAWGSFSSSGNVVYLRQGASEVTVKAGSPNWYESPTQINVTLPASIAIGSLLVYVRSAEGIDSNGQLVSITAP